MTDMNEYTVGFLGFGAYSRALGKGLKHRAGVSIRFFDPHVEESDIGSKVDSVADLVDSDLVFVGLPTGENQIIVALLLLRSHLISSGNKVAVAGFDGLPLFQYFGWQADGIVELIVDQRFISSESAPVGVYVHSESQKVNEFCEKLGKASNSVFYLNSSIEIIKFRVYCCAAPLAMEIAKHSRIVNGISEETIRSKSKEVVGGCQFATECVVTGVAAQHHWKIAKSISELSPKNSVVFEILYQRTVNGKSEFQALDATVHRFVNQSIAFLFRCLESFFAFESSKLASIRTKIDFVDKFSEQHLPSLQSNWQPFLNRFILHRFGGASYVFPDDVGIRAKLAWHKQFPEDFGENCLSLLKVIEKASLGQRSAIVDFESTVIFDGKQQGFSGYRIVIPKEDMSCSAIDETNSPFSLLRAQETKLETSIKRLSLTQDLSEEEVGKLKCYFLWISQMHGAPGDKWRSLGFFPTSHTGMLTDALYILSSDTISDDLAEAASRFQATLYGTRAEWQTVSAIRVSVIAAIFARNFSHVTGSHVISNPEFAEQLVRNGRAKLLSHFTAAKGKFDADYKAEVAFETNQGPPPATDRWEPWNDVECLLSDSIRQLGNPRLDLKVINRFHGYLQARFDFIARAIEDTQDQPEPVFFIAELFNGFLEQEEFLDTLVADLGVRLADMKFEARLELGDNNSSLAFVRKFEQALESNSEATGDCGQWVSERSLDNIEQHDFLVGLPGGMIAAQAFYSLLENVIRNSVKYQPKSTESEPYTLTIVVKDFERRKKDQGNRTLSQAPDGDVENRYLIAIHDNWSTGDAGYEKVRRVIETPLVSAEGKPEKLGLGVQEMKLCAESLVTAEFKSSLNRTEREGSQVVAKGKLSDRRQNLQLRASELADPLAFLLELEQPVLLGLVTNRSTSTRSSKSIVRVESSVRPFFKGHSAHVLVVDAQKQDDLADYLNMATDKDKNHRLLPCRVLVLGNGSAKLHEGLQRWVVGRRVHFLSCTTAYDILFDSQNASGAPAQKDTNLDSEPSKTCCSIGWNDWWNKKIDAEKTSIEKDKLRVLIASVAWLRAYKTAEMKKPADSSDRPCAFKPWLLCIGFERTHAQVAEAWGGILAEFNQHSDLIKVMVRSSPKDGSAQTVDGSYTDSILSFDDNDPKAFINTHLNELDESVRKRLIVFDNHGRCFGKKWSHEAEKACDYQDSVRYFQTFSGSTPDLYRILSRPPKSIFGFSFLIHSLVESCLTNVAIVDERLAGDLMFGDAEDGTTGNDFDNRLATHQKSGVFPVFTMAPKSDARAGRKGHFTPEHKSAFEKLVKTDVCSQEGIAYPVLPNQNDTAELQILKLNNDKQFELRKSGELLTCDVLIVHEGALDILQGKDGIEWKPEYDSFLYEIAPFVLRTSGRGRETKNFQTTVPFIEFHIVSSAVLTSRNKYGLIRGVLGTTGQDS